MSIQRKPHEVAIVLDPAFGENLVSLVERMHLWVVDSPANRAVFERVWQAAGGAYSFDRGVTSFGSSAEPTAQAFERVLALVEEHHGWSSHDPPWTVLLCYGVESNPVRAALAEYGVESIQEQSDHFVAARPLESARPSPHD